MVCGCEAVLIPYIYDTDKTTISTKINSYFSGDHSTLKLKAYLSYRSVPGTYTFSFKVQSSDFSDVTKVVDSSWAVH